MARSTIRLSILLASISLVAAQDATGTYPAVPLASKGPYIYPSGIPYKVDTDVGLVRGTQLGYNVCNSTTENQQSLCQTSWLNALDDFCLWAPPEAGRAVGDIEGSMIAWCTKPGHGARLIPAGALTGVQFTKTPDYVQVVGFIDQTQIDILQGDFGGEMDPHGADLRGNPMGGIVFSEGFTGAPVQAMEWHNFIGSNTFCLKACDPARPNAARFCEHIYDRLGCAYNAPNRARDGAFEACAGDSQDFPGVYTDAAGAVRTYTQPPEALGAITSVGYTARVPASSSCSAFASAALYTGLPGGGTGASGSAAAAATTTTTGAGAGAGTGTSATRAGSSSAALASSTSGAEALHLSCLAVIGAIVSAIILA
ncbi:hypothetical protein HYPSUDRAFT_56435 [Hypholoma sublateritium FD-334 SS-4]|uniref:Macrofage activating glycoprotein n=1 Tax=Hypholoma sublateritium (strain FD-334 SS-4) TaxID=945553 RepID=A0A0D2NLJ6_HYPSF|nr:hypothetical protein HYPSUDRAFT_56435 [Hypholoma sublateritium FD-334 SS-4]